MRSRNKLGRLCLAIGFSTAIALAGCAGVEKGEKESLYRGLGGQEGLEQLVDGLLREIAADQRIVHHFRDVDVALFRERLIEHFCELGNGPCVYSGAPMPEVHKNLGLSDADFNALVENLMQVMQRQKIPLAAQNQLLARLAPLHGNIVGQ